MDELKRIYKAHRWAVLLAAGLLAAGLIVSLFWGAYNLFLSLTGLGVAATIGGARPRNREPAIKAMDEAERVAKELAIIDEGSRAEVKKLNTLDDEERKRRLLDGLD